MDQTEETEEGNLTAEKSDECLAEEIDDLEIEDTQETTDPVKNLSDDESNVFKLEIKTQVADSGLETKIIQASQNAPDVFVPHPRRSMFLQYHKSMVYLYGGKFEDSNDKEITLNDLYSLNLKRFEEWTCINEDKEFKLDQLKKNLESTGMIQTDDMWKFYKQKN